MKEIYRDDVHLVYMTDNGVRITITKNEYNNSKINHFNVFVKEENKKGKTVATRCTMEKAMEIAQSYK